MRYPLFYRMEIDLHIETDEQTSIDELRRATRDTEELAVVEADRDQATIAGTPSAFNELTTALWVRELSARQHGQHGLADADSYLRQEVLNAV